MDSIDILPAAAPFRKTVRVPGSKSITNRALPLAALCEGDTTLTGVLFADDTRQMIHALQTLGYTLHTDEPAKTIRISGRGHAIPDGSGEPFRLTCGNSGTTLRFLTAMLSLGTGEYILDGVPRMRERPIDQLVGQLQALGAKITYDARPGFPPVHIGGANNQAGPLLGGECSFSDAKSSQFISAVLMAAPYAKQPVTLNLLGAITSEPYVLMTLRMMEQFGVRVTVRDVPAKETGPEKLRTITVPTATYAVRDGTYAIEPDASNASYFLAAAAIIPGSSITIEGLGKGSLQGDVAFADVLHRMGAGLAFGRDFVTITAPPDGKLAAIDIDMNDIPDMVQTLAIVALFAEGTTTIRNVWNLRVKETDRLAALETELRKLGATVQTGTDWISITPPPPNHALIPATIATYDDHRMAMAFAIAGLRVDGIRIEDPKCTAKTYPNYFEDLRAAVS